MRDQISKIKNHQYFCNMKKGSHHDFQGKNYFINCKSTTLDNGMTEL